MPDADDPTPPTADVPILGHGIRSRDEPAGLAADALVQRLLDMVQHQIDEQSEQMAGLRALVKWSFGLTIICLVTIVALSGADLAVSTGMLDVWTTGETPTVELKTDRMAIEGGPAGPPAGAADTAAPLDLAAPDAPADATGPALDPLPGTGPDDQPEPDDAPP